MDEGVAAVVDEKALGKSLQAARQSAGLTQQELCQKAGLSYSTLAKIERGAIKSPSVFTVASIAAATQTSVEELLGIQKAGSPAPLSPKKKSKTGISFVFFDVNGVLLRFFHGAFSQIAHDSGTSTDSIETLFWRHNDSVCRGELSIGEFNQIMGEELGIENFDWEKYYMGNVQPIPEVKELVGWAAENFEIGLISNNMPGFIDKMLESGLIPKLNYKAIIDSSKVQAIKPEPAIYKIAQEQAGAPANEILLTDDSRANLMAADKVGWHVLWFDDSQVTESIDRIRETLAF